MEQETPTPKDLAVLVLYYEKTKNCESDGLMDAIQRRFEKLNEHLSIRLGSGGYHALLRRAAALAIGDLPWLAPINVSNDGTLEGFQSIP